MNDIICLVLLAVYAEACNEQDIEIAAGEVLEGAIESERRGRRGKYKNNACQIYGTSRQKRIRYMLSLKTKALICCVVVDNILCSSYQTQHIVFYCMS